MSEESSSDSRSPSPTGHDQPDPIGPDQSGSVDNLVAQPNEIVIDPETISAMMNTSVDPKAVAEPDKFFSTLKKFVLRVTATALLITTVRVLLDLAVCDCPRAVPLHNYVIYKFRQAYYAFVVYDLQRAFLVYAVYRYYKNFVKTLDAPTKEVDMFWIPKTIYNLACYVLTGKNYFYPRTCGQVTFGPNQLLIQTQHTIDNFCKDCRVYGHSDHGSYFQADVPRMIALQANVYTRDCKNRICNVHDVQSWLAENAEHKDRNARNRTRTNKLYKHVIPTPFAFVNKNFITTGLTKIDLDIAAECFINNDENTPHYLLCKTKDINLSVLCLAKNGIFSFMNYTGQKAQFYDHQGLSNDFNISGKTIDIESIVEQFVNSVIKKQTKPKENNRERNNRERSPAKEPRATAQQTQESETAAKPHVRFDSLRPNYQQQPSTSRRNNQTVAKQSGGSRNILRTGLTLALLFAVANASFEELNQITKTIGVAKPDILVSELTFNYTGDLNVTVEKQAYEMLIEHINPKANMFTYGKLLASKDAIINNRRVRLCLPYGVSLHRYRRNQLQSAVHTDDCSVVVTFNHQGEMRYNKADVCNGFEEALQAANYDTTDVQSLHLLTSLDEETVYPHFVIEYGACKVNTSMFAYAYNKTLVNSYITDEQGELPEILERESFKEHDTRQFLIVPSYDFATQKFLADLTSTEYEEEERKTNMEELEEKLGNLRKWVDTKLDSAVQAVNNNTDGSLTKLADVATNTLEKVDALANSTFEKLDEAKIWINNNTGGSFDKIANKTINPIPFVKEFLTNSSRRFSKNFGNFIDGIRFRKMKMFVGEKLEQIVRTPRLLTPLIEKINEATTEAGVVISRIKMSLSDIKDEFVEFIKEEANGVKTPSFCSLYLIYPAIRPLYDSCVTKTHVPLFLLINGKIEQTNQMKHWDPSEITMSNIYGYWIGSTPYYHGYQPTVTYTSFLPQKLYKDLDSKNPTWTYARINFADNVVIRDIKTQNYFTALLHGYGDISLKFLICIFLVAVVCRYFYDNQQYVLFCMLCLMGLDAIDSVSGNFLRHFGFVSDNAISHIGSFVQLFSNLLIIMNVVNCRHLWRLDFLNRFVLFIFIIISTNSTPFGFLCMAIYGIYYILNKNQSYIPMGDFVRWPITITGTDMCEKMIKGYWVAVTGNDKVDFLKIRQLLDTDIRHPEELIAQRGRIIFRCLAQLQDKTSAYLPWRTDEYADELKLKEGKYVPPVDALLNRIRTLPQSILFGLRKREPETQQRIISMAQSAYIPIIGNIKFYKVCYKGAMHQSPYINGRVLILKHLSKSETSKDMPLEDITVESPLGAQINYTDPIFVEDGVFVKLPSTEGRTFTCKTAKPGYAGVGQMVRIKSIKTGNDIEFVKDEDNEFVIETAPVVINDYFHNGTSHDGQCGAPIFNDKKELLGYHVASFELTNYNISIWNSVPGVPKRTHGLLYADGTLHKNMKTYDRVNNPMTINNPVVNPFITDRIFKKEKVKEDSSVNARTSALLGYTNRWNYDSVMALFRKHPHVMVRISTDTINDLDQGAGPQSNEDTQEEIGAFEGRVRKCKELILSVLSNTMLVIYTLITSLIFYSVYIINDSYSVIQVSNNICVLLVFLWFTGGYKSKISAVIMLIAVFLFNNAAYHGAQTAPPGFDGNILKMGNVQECLKILDTNALRFVAPDGTNIDTVFAGAFHKHKLCYYQFKYLAEHVDIKDRSHYINLFGKMSENMDSVQICQIMRVNSPRTFKPIFGKLCECARNDEWTYCVEKHLQGTKIEKPCNLKEEISGKYNCATSVYDMFKDKIVTKAMLRHLMNVFEHPHFKGYTCDHWGEKLKWAVNFFLPSNAKILICNFEKLLTAAKGDIPVTPIDTLLLYSNPLCVVFFFSCHLLIMLISFAYKLINGSSFEANDVITNIESGLETSVDIAETTSVFRRALSVCQQMKNKKFLDVVKLLIGDFDKVFNGTDDDKRSFWKKNGLSILTVFAPASTVLRIEDEEKRKAEMIKLFEGDAGDEAYEVLTKLESLSPEMFELAEVPTVDNVEALHKFFKRYYDTSTTDLSTVSFERIHEIIPAIYDLTTKLEESPQSTDVMTLIANARRFGKKLKKALNSKMNEEARKEAQEKKEQKRANHEQQLAKNKLISESAIRAGNFATIAAVSNFNDKLTKHAVTKDLADNLEVTLVTKPESLESIKVDRDWQPVIIGDGRKVPLPCGSFMYCDKKHKHSPILCTSQAQADYVKHVMGCSTCFKISISQKFKCGSRLHDLSKYGSFVKHYSTCERGCRACPCGADNADACQTGLKHFDITDKTKLVMLRDDSAFKVIAKAEAYVVTPRSALPMETLTTKVVDETQCVIVYSGESIVAYFGRNVPDDVGHPDYVRVPVAGDLTFALRYGDKRLKEIRSLANKEYLRKYGAITVPQSLADKILKKEAYTKARELILEFIGWNVTEVSETSPPSKDDEETEPTPVTTVPQAYTFSPELYRSALYGGQDFCGGFA